MTENDQTDSAKSDPTPGCSVTVSQQPPPWSAYLSGHPEATALHDPCWGRIMQKAYGNAPFYLTAHSGGNVVGTLQLVSQRSRIFGSHLCSLPYFDAAGILADNPAAHEALLGEARRLLSDSGSLWVELRQLTPIPTVLPGRTDKVTMWLSLPGGAEDLWKMLRTKIRTKVRRAQKETLTLDQGGGELLDDFHAVYVRAMRNLGSPPHSTRFFQLIVDELAGAVRIFVVRSPDGPVAASFVLIDRQGFHVPWSGSNHDAAGGMANRFMYWSMLASASDGGSPRFDFGRSTRGSSTYDFKKDWGAEEVPLSWQYLLPPGGAAPDLRPDSPKYRLATALWRRLPVTFVKFMGPRIIAKLS
jgi:serine/alanine adding enzyme